FGTSPEGTVEWTAVPQALPAPLVDPGDPAAGHLAAIGATETGDPIDTLLGIPVRSREVALQLAAARIAAGDLAGAERELCDYAEKWPHDWRIDWYRGIAALA